MKLQEKLDIARAELVNAGECAAQALQHFDELCAGDYDDDTPYAPLDDIAEIIIRDTLKRLDFKPDLMGKVAYQAYGESTGGKKHDGTPLMTWEELRPDIQKAWIAAGSCSARLWEIANRKKL